MLELAGIIILGILAQWMAWKFKIPAILPLILIGLLVGPLATLYTDGGVKLIQPIWNGEKGLFPGKSLFYFVSLQLIQYCDLSEQTIPLLYRYSKFGLLPILQ